MKVTILYDNTTTRVDLKADWGFACLVEAEGEKILFDTGADGEILMANIEVLGLDPNRWDAIFLSHDHWDHNGGLADLLAIKPYRLYLPLHAAVPEGAGEVVRIDGPQDLFGPFASTGELAGIEQSLVVRSGDGAHLIVGCSHPGVEMILEAARKVGPVRSLIGGFHGFDNVEILADLDLICPTHCTQQIEKILTAYPNTARPGGAGTIITINP